MLEYYKKKLYFINRFDKPSIHEIMFYIHITVFTSCFDRYTANTRKTTYKSILTFPGCFTNLIYDFKLLYKGSESEPVKKTS